MNARRRRIRIGRLERKRAGGPPDRRRGSPADSAEAAHSAAAVAREAASLAESAAEALQDSAQSSVAEVAQFPRDAVAPADAAPPRPEIVEQAAVLVEEAAAMVEHAARVVEATGNAEKTAAPLSRLERRRRPRGARRHEAHVHWKHVALYVPVLVVVVIVGALAIWSFVEKQSMIVAPAPLPPVTIVTTNPQSAQAAAWARFLTNAELAPTVVSASQFHDVRAGGVIALCDADALPLQAAHAISDAVARGHALAILGTPPNAAMAGVRLSADSGLSDDSATISTADSPLLARAEPGYTILTRPAQAAFLREDPGMKVDARWSRSARAAIVHLDAGATRVIWFGIDPDSLRGNEPEFQLVVRTGFRWIAGQPISAAAAAPSAAQAETFSPAVRAAARTDGLAYSADALVASRSLSVTIANRGRRRVDNPVVKVWLPRDVKSCGVGGDLFMRRDVTATYAPDDDACMVTVPFLRPGAERVVKVTTIRK